MAKVSRALWPRASTTRSARSSSVLASPAGAAGDRQAAHLAGLDPQVDDAGAEADLAAEPFDLGAHLLDHADQAEGADVRLGDEGDFLGRAGLDELLDHLARQVARVADLAPQLAVGKGAGAALAELDVGFRVEHAAPPQAPGVPGALAHRAAALEHDRTKAHLRQHQRGEQAARAEADDHRPRCGTGGEVGRRPGDEAIAGVGRRAHMRVAGVAGEHRRLALDLAVEGVDEDDRGALPRVVAALEHAQGAQTRVGDAEPGPHRGPQVGLGMLERKADLGEADHRVA